MKLRDQQFKAWFKKQAQQQLLDGDSYYAFGPAAIHLMESRR
jgi:hypothetical protein